MDRHRLGYQTPILGIQTVNQHKFGHKERLKKFNERMDKNNRTINQSPIQINTLNNSFEINRELINKTDMSSNPKSGVENFNTNFHTVAAEEKSTGRNVVLPSRYSKVKFTRLSEEEMSLDSKIDQNELDLEREAEDRFES